MNAEKKPNILRRKYMIHPKFQWRFIMGSIVAALILFALMLVITSMTFGDIYQMGQDSGFSDRNPYFSFIQTIETKVYVSLAIAFLLGTLPAIFVMVFMSHKIAGPIYRMRKYFSEIRAGGPVGPLKFREKDHLEDFADEINEAIGVLLKK